ncbi:hypothetical protein [Mycoplasma putrefaciens]|uniref:Uncharacterized protein n=1 Tax=Mycoplasma putrefaciens (strain ATCC 15718 / NCTC 10155 / C30 KS-1 / KS-1) TaxID=743965 RepID=A0A7U3ZT68_MYCPK|nr:hypothetical protein [Mycoplasma putrefaciens]AEM69038.1 hypothetical protein MPUT_0703 [Mycoplasma putrefaciens KS1]
MKLKRNLSLVGVSLFVIPITLQTANHTYTKIVNKNSDLKVFKSAADEIDEHSKLVDDAFSGQKQEEYFKNASDLKFEDLYSESEYNYDNQQIKKSFNYTNLAKFSASNDEINKKQAIKDNYEKIISGKLKVSDILNDAKNMLLSHKKEFISFKKELDKSIKLYELEHLSEPEDKYTENELKHIQTYKSLTMSSDWKNKSISRDDIESVLKLEKLQWKLDEYITHKKSFVDIKVAITAIAWGTVAFYTASWWMFGGNIPFIVAATLQATTLTILTIKSREEIDFLTGTVNEIKEKIKKQDSKTLFKFIKDFLKSEASKSLENISEAFSDLLFNFITVINGESPLTAYNAIRQISTAFDDIEYYLPNFYSSKFDEVVSKIMAAALVLSRAIAVCVATTWASPAAVKVITFASIIERFADNITSLVKLTLVNLV